MFTYVNMGGLDKDWEAVTIMQFAGEMGFLTGIAHAERIAFRNGFILAVFSSSTPFTVSAAEVDLRTNACLCGNYDGIEVAIYQSMVILTI